MHRYRAYGLAIHSDIALPFADDHAEIPDVTIERGPTDHPFGPDARAFGLSKAERGAFYMHDPRYGSILVRDGRRVTFESIDDGRIRVFLTGSGLTALLQQRGLLTLHASSIRTPHGAVAFAGRSGAGKSTLAVEMRRRGYPLIADDVTAICFERPAEPMAIPAYPGFRLWQDTMNHLEISQDAATRRLTGIDKFIVPSEAINVDPVRIRAIYLLYPARDAPISIQPMARINAFNSLSDFTHRKRICKAQGLWPDHFGKITTLLQSVECRQVRRPLDTFRLTELADQLEEDFLSLDGAAAVATA
ncbi:hypothetical protein ABS767_02940 [Sphingomonas sp. ST-64]|uniref:Hpr(Ser) kinase/phosphatase n=1 Tax=Sphingomonas plantiphila TaxID=3163295 RepID=A0ABW8YL16_9SPHN